MPFRLGAVDGLLHAAQHGEVDRALLRLPGHLGNDSFDFEAAFQRVTTDAQVTDEFGERFELARIGRLVDAA